MIPIHKLARLPAGQRRRKLALILAGFERTGLGDAAYILALVSLALEDPKIGETERGEILAKKGAVEAAQGSGPELAYRLCNTCRHALLSAAGAVPAEWDLIVPGDPSGSASRSYFPGVTVYAEDIRSPFNIGSIFRTAEAFGAERVIVSPLCVPPEHPRAARSAMGALDWLPWERLSLDELPRDVPVFALETGGTPIEEFDFPERGIVIVGSEELGISPEGLARADYGRVSIPMKGIKASVNVGVAFGVLMQAWTNYLRCSASNPD